MHGVPHLALADDEVFEEDIPLRLPQLLEEDREEGLTALEIAGLAVPHGRAEGGILDVGGLTRGLGAFLPQLRQGAAFIHDARPGRLVHDAHFPERAL